MRELRSHETDVMKPLLVGEANPYGGDPDYALYPYPRGCAGHRLCEKIMGLTDREYLDRFERVNLCATRWRIKEARLRSAEIEQSHQGGVVVMLGARVTGAFGFSFRPFTQYVGFLRYVTLPHPSGLSRLWNAPGSYERARDVLRVAGVLQ